MTDAPAALTVDSLACARGGIPLLEGVSFALNAGEALVLRGPNGCGKTTLLRTLAGLQPPLAGRISAPPESIAYAAHADGLKPTLTATETLQFWARLHGQGGVTPALERMNLAVLAQRQGQHLSAGQKRRLGLARLLVTGRPIWVLDEPTVSLDSASVALFAGVVREHLARGGLAVIATHVDLGLPEARSLEIARFRATTRAAADDFLEAFL
ncbi:heme ABC exporter ATP-binding protein CcmA [Rhodobacteraceae bacterium WD3A24]|nr:heme ABC exporter ATP-binding protein CcmA [Rhodobacteraceae bacterium WD3A24]